MTSSPSDLTLDYKPNGNGSGAASYAVIPKHPPPQEPLAVDAAGHHHHHHHHHLTEQATQKLREFLARLEEERLKIDAFKRELPLCMQLLNHAMESYRQQLEACQMGSVQGAAARPLVLEEFMPLKNLGIDAAADKLMLANHPPSETKASWMESAQLWNGGPTPASAASDVAAAKGPQTPKESSEHPLPIDTTLVCAHDAAGHRSNGGAFLPFAKDKAAAAALPELALAPADKDAAAAADAADRKPYLDGGARRDDGGGQNGVKPAAAAANAPEGQQQAAAAQPPQTHRKARRCWSPELHRRFVNALQILGGAQVATPKQIRELMKVDGLTNDEVKSHLQKYRLHTRRPMPAPPAPATAAPQLVVLGGIWVPPEYATQAGGPAAIYGAHPATQPHYTAAVAAAAAAQAQEYYHHQSPAAAAAVHHHHHLQHHHPAMVHRATAPPQQQVAYRAAAMAAGSPPGSEGRMSSGGAGGGGAGSVGGGGGRERSESIEEEGEGEEREEDDDDEDDDMVAANKADGEEAIAGAGGVVVKY